ncbi:hypothetical protein AB4Z43_29410 [Mesorhizobium sp. 2RAF45]|uniref:hypothetical protein n=1 Tax=Mesorhizobium sp. 2RAF45 TaxID=3233001 RepID=UPI003F9E7691
MAPPNDWDRDQVHDEGETIGSKPKAKTISQQPKRIRVIQIDGEVVEKDDDNAYQTATKHYLTMKKRRAIARHPTREGRFDGSWMRYQKRAANLGKEAHASGLGLFSRNNLRLAKFGGRTAHSVPHIPT